MLAQMSTLPKAITARFALIRSDSCVYKQVAGQALLPRENILTDVAFKDLAGAYVDHKMFLKLAILNEALVAVSAGEGFVPA